MKKSKTVIETRRSFPKEFKSEVCRLVSSGRSQREVAEKFELSPSLLSKWMSQGESEGKDAFRGLGNRTELEGENHRLRAEVKELKLEREILKKASAYFAKHLV